jgi:predicted HicB family RNase H-like nuclease
MPPSKKPRKVGRPAMPKGQAHARIVPVRFNEDLFRAITMAAKTAKQTVSEWIRGTIEAELGR